ncbi:type II secretion system protein [Verrucomicrobiales bacterium BCK34]|nr:type II secretion system protein [Verrucomicrobiales bacterium BCK34]
MKFFSKRSYRQKGYTLIEALVASGVLLIGVSAACSMSLSLVTQEEINERSVRAFNYLDNAARLYRLGMEPSEIPALLPNEPIVDSITFVSRQVSANGMGPTGTASLPIMRITMTYFPSGATAAYDKDVEQWTGGDKAATRSEHVDVLRSESVQVSEFSRVSTLAP